MPILFAFFLMLVHFSWMYQAGQALDDGAQEAARAFMVPGATVVDATTAAGYVLDAEPTVLTWHLEIVDADTIRVTGTSEQIAPGLPTSLERYVSFTPVDFLNEVERYGPRTTRRGTTRCGRTRWGSERGAMGTEAAIVTVVMFGFISILAYAAAVTSAGGAVADAAGEGARAAAQADSTRTLGAATAAVEKALDGWCTGGPAVSVLGPEPIVGTGVSQLAVEVTCDVDLSVAGAGGLPGSRTMTSRRAAVIDRLRGDGA